MSQMSSSATCAAALCRARLLELVVAVLPPSSNSSFAICIGWAWLSVKGACHACLCRAIQKDKEKEQEKEQHKEKEGKASDEGESPYIRTKHRARLYVSNGTPWLCASTQLLCAIPAPGDVALSRFKVKCAACRDAYGSADTQGQRGRPCLPACRGADLTYLCRLPTCQCHRQLAHKLSLHEPVVRANAGLHIPPFRRTPLEYRVLACLLACLVCRE